MNLLKPYCERNQAVLLDVKTVAVLNTPTYVGKKDIDINQEICQGMLPNSKILTNWDVHLSYLDSLDRFEITKQLLNMMIV